jgi:hypothetical protein
MDKILSRLPLWVVGVGAVYIAMLLTYSVYSGRKVSFFGIEIGSHTADTVVERKSEKQVELWTIKGSLSLKTYGNLKPALVGHQHNLLLRVEPPEFNVAPDGQFTIKNVPILVDGDDHEEALIEVYPITDLFSQGYGPEAIRISHQPGTYGNTSYSVSLDVQKKVATILTPVLIKNPSREFESLTYSPPPSAKPQKHEK